MIAQAYSGDVVQLQADDPDLDFIVPEAGGTTFVDVMVIPITTRNQLGAEEWMNYVYDRANYAQLVNYVQYVPVLSDMTDELTKLDPEVANNPLINPPEDVLGRLSTRGRRCPTNRTPSTRPSTRTSRGSSAPMAGVATSGRRRSRVGPYLLVAPALVYLVVFFVVPIWSLFRTSLSSNAGSVFLPSWSSAGTGPTTAMR